MSGFATFNDIVLGLSQSGHGQRNAWLKNLSLTTTAGGLYTLWNSAGIPDVGTYSGTALHAQQVVGGTTPTTGVLGVSPASGGRVMFLLALAAACATGAGTLYVWDRLLYYPGISHTLVGGTVQTFVQDSALPRATSGVGVYCWLETTTLLGATASNVTVLYKDPDGNETAAQTTGAQATIASSIVSRLPHAFPWFPLAAGDTGMQRATSIVFSAQNTAGASALVLGKLLAVIPIPLAGVATVADLVRGPQLTLPQLEDNVALGFTWLAGSAVASPSFTGLSQFCEG